MSFALNQVIGNYECLGIVDKPRTGVTYRVRNRTTGEIEALRALPGATSRDPESAERLLREIRVQTRLWHPNVVVFHDAFELDGHVVMTTEFVDGATLAERCRGGPLPPGEAVAAICQVLAGLEEAHALGIVHRGITAEHVVAAPDGTVKLGGFDLAKPASDANLTQAGAVLGDPRYISPEQVMGRALDGRADLYSVGVLLYQTLTGKLPFEGLNDFDVLAAHVNSEPRPPSALNPAIPAELDGLVLRALRKDPGQRFANAAEFRDALAAAAKRIADRPAAVASSPAEAPKARRFPTAAVSIVLVVLAIGLAVVLLVALH